MFVLWLLTGMFAASADQPLATVDGVPVTLAEVQLLAHVRGIQGDQLAQHRQELLDVAIDRALVRAFLSREKIVAPPEMVAAQVQQMHDLIRAGKEEPEAFALRLGTTWKTWEDDLALPLAWSIYVQRKTSRQQIADYFSSHRSEFDGTKVRARQIVLLRSGTTTPAELTERSQRLNSLRSEILAGKVDFATAAKSHSESPSAQHGGDLGLITFSGRIPRALAQAAFQLKLNDISEPVVTPFGVHIVQVTEIVPGQLSLEDARPEILEQLGQSLWTSTVKELRVKAKIIQNSK